MAGSNGRMGRKGHDTQFFLATETYEIATQDLREMDRLQDRTPVASTSTPRHMQISVLVDEKTFVVVDKPPNLRSVPGNASDPTDNNERKRKRTDSSDHPAADEKPRQKAYVSWVLALQSFSSETGLVSSTSAVIRKVLVALAQSSHSSIPRNRSKFAAYLKKNWKRLVGDAQASSVPESIAEDVHAILEARKDKFMNKPEATRPEESAKGQVETFGGKLCQYYVVHRLDCEVSHQA